MVKYQVSPPHSKGCLSAKEQKPENDEEERFLGNWFGDGILWEHQYMFITTQMVWKWMLEWRESMQDWGRYTWFSHFCSNSVCSISLDVGDQFQIWLEHQNGVGISHKMAYFNFLQCCILHSIFWVVIGAICAICGKILDVVSNLVVDYHIGSKGVERLVTGRSPTGYSIAGRLTGQLSEARLPTVDATFYSR